MARRSEFVEHVVETMRLLGPVEAKAMFGGWGLFHQGAFFALVAGDTLYLKTDADNRAAIRGASAWSLSFSRRRTARRPRCPTGARPTRRWRIRR